MTAATPGKDLAREVSILARDVVRFVGERIAVVAAEDPEVTEEADSLDERAGF